MRLKQFINPALSLDFGVCTTAYDTLERVYD